MIAEERRSGPEGTPLVVALGCDDEVVVSGFVQAQAWHEDGGERDLYYAVYRNENMLTQGIQECKFVNGRLEHRIPFGLIDLPDNFSNVYHLVWRLEDPLGGPAYTGMPQFDCRLRARPL